MQNTKLKMRQVFFGNDGSEVVIAVEGNKNNKSEVEEGAVIVIVEFVKDIKPEVTKDIKPEVVVVNNPKVGGALALVGMERKNKDETKPEEETNIGNGNECIGNEEFEGFEEEFVEFEGLENDKYEESLGVVMGKKMKLKVKVNLKLKKVLVRVVVMLIIKNL